MKGKYADRVWVGYANKMWKYVDRARDRACNMIDSVHHKGDGMKGR